MGIAAHLNLQLGDFLSTYCKNFSKVVGWRMLKYKAGADKDCIFLEDKLCSIYKVRPTQCATYPWWPDLMNPASWQIEAAEVCEGLDHEDAESLDVQQASEKLMTAAEYFVMKDAAPRRTKT